MYSFGMLTGSEILKYAESGLINIGKIDPTYAGPNSYDIEIGDTITMYRNMGNSTPFDIKNKDSLETITYDLDERGTVLHPGQLYLIPSRYTIGSDVFIPIMTGRSSIGRLGISVHQEAGFGDLGFNGVWTLQVTVIHPVKIYPYTRMAQIYFITPAGSRDNLYHGKYQHSVSAAGSQIYLDTK